MKDQRMRWMTLLLATFVVLWGAAGCGRKAGRTAPGDGGTPVAEGQEGSNVLSGRVLDAEGSPVPDAEVLVYIVISDTRGSDLTVDIVDTSRTGEDGAYRFTVPASAEPFAMVSVAARKAGYAIGWITARDFGDEEEKGTGEIRLGTANEIAGSVVDEEGSPVSGATLLAFFGLEKEEGGPEYLFALKPFDWTQMESDSAGFFRFSAVPEGATVGFQASAPGRARIFTMEESVEMFPYRAGQTNITLVLPSEARIAGKVVAEAKGRAVAGQRVLVHRDPERAAFTSQSAQTDDAGRFEIGGLEAGTHTVRLVPADPDESVEWVAEPVWVTVASGETATDVVLRLQEGGIIEVQVTTEKEGKPVEGAKLSFSGGDRSEPLRFTTGEDGEARRRVLPGDYRLQWVYHKDYRRPVNLDHTVTVEEGKTTGLEFALETKPVVSGVVRDPGGAPVEGVAVQVVPRSRRGTTSDKEGRFELSWDASSFWGMEEPPASYLVATHRDSNLVAVMELEDVTEQLEIELGPGVVLAGRVVDPDGKPIAVAKVRVIFSSGSWSSTLDHEDISTDEEGTYRVTALAAGQDYRVQAEAEGFGRSTVDADTLDPTSNTVAVADIVLLRADFSVAGTVMDEDEKPVAGVSINLSGSGQRHRSTQSDEEGKFTIDGVCPGTVQLHARGGRGGPGGSVTAEAGDQDVQLILGDHSGYAVPTPELPPSLVGRPLPGLDSMGIDPGEAPAPGAPVLVCFWDMDQRPSRHGVALLAGRAERLDALGVQVLLLHARPLDTARMGEETAGHQALFSGGAIEADVEETWQAWGIRGLPWFILADTQQVVRADGFDLAALETELAQLTAEGGSPRRNRRAK